MSDVQPHYNLQLRVLEALSAAANYNKWITSLALPHLGDHPIEIGSGIGDQAALWLDAGVPRITLSDLEQRSLETLARRFAGDERIDLRQLDLGNPGSGSYSSVVALNVLEHIENDVGALVGAASLVAPDGRVVVFVPAFGFAMSRLDRALGHFRRYTRSSLSVRFEEAGLEPVLVEYVNAPGLIAWFVMMRLLGRMATDRRSVRAWDRTIVPTTRRLESWHYPPFGQSVLGVARTAS